MTALVDCHSHSALSGHGSGSVEDMVARACELGLAVYCMTEHWTLPQELDHQRGDSMSPADAETYLQTLAGLKEELASRNAGTRLVIGAELDWLNWLPQRFAQLPEDVEYVLGSIHFLQGKPLDNDEDMMLWNELGTDGVWKLYLQEWLEMAAAPGPVHALSHPDLPKVFGQLPSFDLAPYYREMAAVAAESGRMVEVNTAGWRKPAAEQYPALPLLEEFRKAGVECTVGADAHKPAAVAADISRAYDVMRAAGYTRVAVPAPSGGRAHLDL